MGPYFRRYELPWSPSEDMERRFRTIFRSFAVVFVILAILVPFLPREEKVNNTESLPERVVQLVIEPPPPPPPPPPKPKPVEQQPVKPTPVPKVVDPRVAASKSGLLANLDQLAALRDVNLDKFSKNQAKTNDPGDVSVVQRSMITSKAGATSGGIATSSISSGLAAGSGSLHGIHTTQVRDPALAAGTATTRSGGSGKASRSAEEVALVFDKNKGAIYALYTRALRDKPAMQGKVVVELTIAPSGDITNVRIVSSELDDPEFEAKLKARIQLFKFDAKDVAPLTTTKPIDFFPA
jgi:TonB family protein